MTEFHKFFKDKEEGRDYNVEVQKVENANVAIIAIHGGIELYTDLIAKEIAKEDCNYYVFVVPEISSFSFASMHLTSSQFDDERCIQVIENCSTVISIHGCKNYGAENNPILIGGLDDKLKTIICEELNNKGILAVIDTSRFPATSVDNICNRGKGGKGVQLEIPNCLRRDLGNPQKSLEIASIIRLIIDEKRYQ